jgi:hypothetical protein
MSRARHCEILHRVSAHANWRKAGKRSKYVVSGRGILYDSNDGYVDLRMGGKRHRIVAIGTAPATQGIEGKYMTAKLQGGKSVVIRQKSMLLPPIPEVQELEGDLVHLEHIATELEAITSCKYSANAAAVLRKVRNTVAFAALLFG